MTDLTGKPIAITGASSGIGRATALACARAGMPVAAMARRADRLGALCDEIRGGGGRAIAVPGSVEDPDACAGLIARTAEAFGGVYAAFANAGYGEERDTLETPDGDLRAMFEVNFWGSLNLARPAAGAMRRAGSGHLLLCSSCLSKIGLPRYAAYCATKAAQDHFGRAMRHELRPHGVRVSTVHPIGTRTEFFETAEARSGGLRLMDRAAERTMQPPEKVARAVVSCLRRPRGEVWTSVSTRLVLAAAVAAPGLADLALGAMVRARSGRGES